MSVILLRAALTLAGVTVAAVLVPGPAYAGGTRISHDEATRTLRANGITWSSSGNCSDRNNRRCTSFEQILSGTVDGVVTLHNASRCAVNVTGGTEAGHAPGPYSHSNGYKVDVATDPKVTTCIDRYVRANFRQIADRSDGAPQYRSAAGNIYANEGTHWDITYS